MISLWGGKGQPLVVGPVFLNFHTNPVFSVSQISPQRPRDRHPADCNRISWLQIQIWLIPSLLSPLHPAGSGAPAYVFQQTWASPWTRGLVCLLDVE